MPYIGNTIRAADDYRLIDDISSSFNGSTTSFALQVAGSAPVPFPKSPQQVLISVNGVIQEPDPTGSSGFNLVGTNIVFSSAPTNGHAFFGIIYATADYLNAGGNFPSGSLGAPSITFIGDENSGLYRKGGGSVGFVSDATEIANFDSNGITISSGNLILGDSAGASSDRVVLGASSDLSIYHDGSHSRIDETGTGNLMIQTNNEVLIKKGTAENIASFNVDGAVELYHDNSKKFETWTSGARLPSDNNVLAIGAGDDLRLWHNATNSIIRNATGQLQIQSNDLRLGNYNFTETYLKALENGAVELYYDNTKRFETTTTGVKTLGDVSFRTSGNTQTILYDESDGQLEFVDTIKAVFGTGNDLQIYHDGSNSRIVDSGTGNLNIDSSAVVIRSANAADNLAKFIQNAACELYHNASKKFETLSTGCAVTGELDVSGNIDLNSDSHRIKIGAGDDFQFYHDGSNNYIFTNNGDIIMQTSGDDIQLLAEDDIVLKVQGGVENAINCIGNGAVELYNDNVKRFSTNSSGAQVHGNNGNIFTASCATNSTASILFSNTEANTSGDMRVLVKVAANQGSDPYIKFDAGGNDMIVGTLYAGGANNKLVLGHGGSPSGGVIGLHIDGNGQITPDSNNARDLGSSSLRFRNVYTNDLNLSNEGSSNDVDSTWGNYTIQEGHEDLFLINNRTGKKFKFNLTEVS